MGPLGSVRGLFSYHLSSEKSPHHSYKLPCMSCRPKAFGSFVPTGCGLPSAFLSYQPY